MQVQPYLMFDGRCEEALELYRKTLDSKVEALMRFKECPESQEACVGASPEKVMHSTFRIGDTGGQVQMPLAKTFFASSFGVVADKFGVSWMIVTEG